MSSRAFGEMRRLSLSSGAFSGGPRDASTNFAPHCSIEAIPG